MPHLLRALPPYAEFKPIELVGPQPPGAVLGLPVRRGSHEAVGRNVEAVLRVAPSAALVGISDEIDTEERVNSAAVLAMCGVPLIRVGGAEELDSELRQALTRPSVILHGAPALLRGAGLNDPLLVDMVVSLLSHTLDNSLPESGSNVAVCTNDAAALERLARNAGLTQRGLRARCARARRFPPVQWRRGTRLVGHAVALQRHGGVPFTRLASEFGYTDLPSMDRAFRHHLGVTPSFVRERLGWQWLVWKWLTKQRELAGFGTIVPIML
jgi:AraC-like DNA-binding protein